MEGYDGPFTLITATEHPGAIHHFLTLRYYNTVKAVQWCGGSTVQTQLNTASTTTHSTKPPSTV